MSELIKASQLDSSHIGKAVRLRLGSAVAQDTLLGVKHTGRLISEGGICEEPKITVGGIETTLTLENLGEVDCEPHQNVDVLG